MAEVPPPVISQEGGSKADGGSTAVSLDAARDQARLGQRSCERFAAQLAAWADALDAVTPGDAWLEQVRLSGLLAQLVQPSGACAAAFRACACRATIMCRAV
jgi:hypothetical protein